MEKVTWWYEKPGYAFSTDPQEGLSEEDRWKPLAFRGRTPQILAECEDLVDKIREGFNYDPRNGKLYYSFMLPYQEGRKATKPSGSETGACKVRFYDMTVSSANLVWLLHYGRWPKGRLRRLNGDYGDDRIENLAEAPDGALTAHERRQMTDAARLEGRPIPRPRRQPSRGVARCGPNHWQAFYRRDGRQFNLGRFKTEAEALDARRAWEAQDGQIADLV